MRSLCVLLVAAVVLPIALPSAAAQDKGAKFQGEIVARLLDDGINIELVKPFGYIDSKGRVWDVPAGTQTDGASIPRVFWVTHPPFTGKYRAGAVIHDHYCRTQSRTWQDTHNVFFEAMRTAGVDDRTAKVMWAAVHHFGPRWGPGVLKRGKPATVEEERQFVQEIEAWLARANPTREEIAKAINSGSIPR